ncbi:uncharacterized protein LOC128290602 [Gossypium arboreum]|uniref:uncharacterized protein LOC128290602 n=1 Tax=Gossypium arboreum TaxID=29729 RepID=UPI0022F1B987|nr:uncharacterized protein LOC128290602 [Gossypium arboreum]
MDQRLKRLEQLQKEMQDQLQLQMQEQLAKIQQDMRDQMLESQRDMMNQLSQLLTKGLGKGKSPMLNTGENNEEPLYPPGFTPIDDQTCPQDVPIAIRSQQHQAGISAPMNYPTGSGSNPRNSPTNHEVPDLNEMAGIEKAKVELARQLEVRYKWLEEKLRVMENADYHRGVDAKDLSLVPDLVLPPKFKTPEFEKYNGTSCPKAHITMFCRKMTGYVDNNQLLIHCFQDSLIGSAAKWYNQLSRAKIHSWRDLAQAFMKQYGHVKDMTPDRITLQNMEKKQGENFRQYAQRWRDVATQVQPPLLEKKTTILFVNTLKAPFITHMLGNATMSFSDIVMSGEMIENAIRSGKIDARESAKRSTPNRNENKVNNMSKGYPKLVNIGQPRQESNSRPNTERLQFTPIPMSYKELYQNLFDVHVVSPVYSEPVQPLFPKWYNENAQCEYHAGIVGHSIENCTTFKKLVERFIEMGVVKFDDSSKPNRSDNAVNTI